MSIFCCNGCVNSLRRPVCVFVRIFSALYRSEQYVVLLHYCRRLRGGLAPSKLLNRKKLYIHKTISFFKWIVSFFSRLYGIGFSHCWRQFGCIIAYKHWWIVGSLSIIPHFLISIYVLSVSSMFTHIQSQLYKNIRGQLSFNSEL